MGKARNPDDCCLDMCCHAAGAFELLGKRWTGQVLTLLLQRPARFSELSHALPRMSDRMLAERLRELVDAGLVERVSAADRPARASYALTARGEALRPVIDSLRSWARECMPSARDEQPATTGGGSSGGA